MADILEERVLSATDNAFEWAPPFVFVIIYCFNNKKQFTPYESYLGPREYVKKTNTRYRVFNSGQWQSILVATA